MAQQPLDDRTRDLLAVLRDLLHVPFPAGYSDYDHAMRLTRERLRTAHLIIDDLVEGRDVVQDPVGFAADFARRSLAHMPVTYQTAED